MVGKTLLVIFLFLLSLTAITGILQLEMHMFVFGTLMLVDFAIYVRWVCSNRGRKELKEYPIEDDPCGNSNLNIKPWDIM